LFPGNRSLDGCSSIAWHPQPLTHTKKPNVKKNPSRKGPVQANPRYPNPKPFVFRLKFFLEKRVDRLGQSFVAWFPLEALGILLLLAVNQDPAFFFFLGLTSPFDDLRRVSPLISIISLPTTLVLLFFEPPQTICLEGERCYSARLGPPPFSPPLLPKVVLYRSDLGLAPSLRPIQSDLTRRSTLRLTMGAQKQRQPGPTP